MVNVFNENEKLHNSIARIVHSKFTGFKICMPNLIRSVRSIRKSCSCWVQFFIRLCGACVSIDAGSCSNSLHACYIEEPAHSLPRFYASLLRRIAFLHALLPARVSCSRYLLAVVAALRTTCENATRYLRKCYACNTNS